jgi:N-acetylglucosaminyldiphosphoundecaprenol N-acetyl-beta-D-mannosaminyltransferase
VAHRWGATKWGKPSLLPAQIKSGIRVNSDQVKMNMLGIDMNCVSYREMEAVFDQWLSNKESKAHSLALVNVNCCVSALFDRSLRDIYNSADLIGIDSMPFLKWARIFYKSDADRLYAPDIMLHVSQRAKDKGYTFFIYGGYPGAPEKIEAYLKERFEGINIVGTYSPPFRPFTKKENDSICEMVNEARPDFLWIGLGSPKQDLWIHENKHKLKGCIIVPSGATFDFFSGRIKQAPQFIRDLGFEWLYRLMQDFRRLWVRYTVYNIIFVSLFALQLLGILRFRKAK